MDTHDAKTGKAHQRKSLAWWEATGYAVLLVLAILCVILRAPTWVSMLVIVSVFLVRFRATCFNAKEQSVTTA